MTSSSRSLPIMIKKANATSFINRFCFKFAHIMIQRSEEKQGTMGTICIQRRSKMISDLLTEAPQTQTKQTGEHVVRFFRIIPDAQTGNDLIEVIQHSQGMRPDIVDM